MRRRFPKRLTTSTGAALTSSSVRLRAGFTSLDMRLGKSCARCSSSYTRVRRSDSRRIPAYGLYRDLAESVGVPHDRVLMTEIGSIIEFDNGKGAVRGRATAGSVFVDRLGDFEPGKVRLRTRDDLASDGLVTITIIVDAETGKLIAGPEFVTKGLSLEVLAGPLRQAEQELKRWLERRPEGEPEVGYLVSQAKGITASSLFRKTKQRPMILPMVMEL